MSLSVGGWFRRQYGSLLSRSVSTSPSHVAVIQDGNRRYAESRGLERSAGHQQGASTTEELLNWCLELDISTVTLYTFSTENFNRPADEQASLFDLIAEKLYELADADRIHDNAVRIRGLGDIARLPSRVQDAVGYAENQTDAYDQLQLNVALAYGGRHELLTAAQTIAQNVASGGQSVDAISTDTIETALYRESVPDVDLLVRTGGAQRTSNFLPWYAMGGEAVVYFSDVYWPAFSRLDFLRALHTYATHDQTFHQRRVNQASSILETMRRRARTIWARYNIGGEQQSSKQMSTDGGNNCTSQPATDPSETASKE